MEKVTVLTAVYNAENYLRPCLDSLMNQSLADCQFICIDDSSTDGSLKILQEYADKDSRFLVLHQSSNQGQAHARNYGLQFATGEYVAMLDADDWYAPDTLERAYDALKVKDADCVVLRLMQCFEDGSMAEFPIKSSADEWSGEEAFVLSLDWSLHGLYVVKSTIHKQYPFDASCKLYSDDNSTRMHYLHSNRVVLCDGQYFYRKHSQSMTNACSIRRFDYMLANLSMKRQIEAEVQNGVIGDSILSLYEKHRWLNVVGCYWYYYQNRNLFATEEKEEISQVFSRVLPTIEAGRIPYSLKLKFGYYPFTDYKLFSVVENLYFFLRSLLGR